MARINQLSMPRWAGVSWRRRMAAAGAGGVLAAAMVVAAAGPAAAGGSPVLAFTPSPFDYGQVAVGQAATETFTLTNSGGKASGRVTFTLPGSAEFTITATTCPGLGLGPGMTCMVTVRFAPTSLGTVTATLTATGQHAAATDSLTGTSVVHLYWTDSGAGTVNVISLPSTTVQTLVSGQNVPAGLAVDSSHLYWTNSNAGTIMRANLDGTGVTTLVTGQMGPFGVAVDSSHLYWTNQGNGTVDQANLDGTGVTTLVTGQNGPAGVAVSP